MDKLRHPSADIHNSETGRLQAQGPDGAESLDGGDSQDPGGNSCQNEDSEGGKGSIVSKKG